MQVIRCDTAHDAAWNAYVRQSPRASFYHRAEWRAVNARAFGHESVHLAAVDEGRIVGVLPLVRLESLFFGSIACSMPFVNFGGPCGDTDDIEHRLMRAAEQVVEEWKSDYLEVRSLRRIDGAYPCSDHKVSMTIELESDPDVLWQRFKTGHRNEIKRAYKNGFEARFGADLVDDFYEVLSHSWRELGTPIYDLSYLKAVLAAFPESTRVCVIYAADGTPAAGAFDGLHAGTVEGMWLGIRPEYRKRLAGYVLYWELIKHACTGGAVRFHLGRSSKDSNAEQFKKKWNADPVQLYWHYVLRRKAAMPNLNPSNPKFQLAIRTWRQLPVRVTQVIGPMIARSIP